MTDTNHKLNPETSILVQDVPKNLDPRMYAATFFESSKGAPFDNKMASASCKAKINNTEVTFSVPAHAALCLNVSHNAFKQMQQIPVERLFQKTSYGNAAEAGLSPLYTWFELMFVNIVFSFTALEAFSNQVTPDTFVFSKLRQDKKCEENYNKKQIERNLSLDVKLTEVLPKLTGTPFTKETKLWSEYSSLRAIRDRIIHVKSADIGIYDADNRSIWDELLDRRNIDSSLVAHKVIKHFPIKNDNHSPVAEGRNRWVSMFPFDGTLKT
jgi:hypothetical protein